MRDPFLRSFSGRNAGGNSCDETADSWLNRVRENLAQLLIPAHFKPSSANGAPIHLLTFDKSLRPARAQGASLVTHIAVFTAILIVLAQPPGLRPVPAPGHSTPGPVSISTAVIRTITSANPDDGGGKGGNHNPLPATHGNPPPFSSMLLVRPTIPPNQNLALPVPPTILDPAAAPVLTPTENLGLPWMTKGTRSPGPGDGTGIGSTDGNSVGNGGPEEYGPGGSRGPSGVGATQPTCSYCPLPTYTDEARHGKVQGSVTLQVLVSADGRAQDIRIVKGVGFGLDERAVETIRSWRFIAARDGAKRAVAAWVTVETVFRLF
jgi:protein TonB